MAASDFELSDPNPNHPCDPRSNSLLRLPW